MQVCNWNDRADSEQTTVNVDRYESDWHTDAVGLEAVVEAQRRANAAESFAKILCGKLSRLEDERTKLYASWMSVEAENQQAEAVLRFSISNNRDSESVVLENLSLKRKISVMQGILADCQAENKNYVAGKNREANEAIIYQSDNGIYCA